MRKWKFILWGILMASTIGCLSRKESHHPPPSQYRLKIDSVIRLSGLREMKETKFLIPFENVSGDTFCIRAVETFCGCLECDFPKSPIMPHDTASLRMTIIPSSAGYIERKIQIYIGEDNREITVILKGMVKSIFK